MTGRVAPVLKLRLAFGAAVIVIVCVAAYVMESLPWQADGVLAGALALAYTYDLDRAGQRPGASDGRHNIRR
ncbi:MAG: hypothetical protein ABJC89_14460 [Acidobacteriota bacterium]